LFITLIIFISLSVSIFQSLIFWSKLLYIGCYFKLLRNERNWEFESLIHSFIGTEPGIIKPQHGLLLNKFNKLHFSEHCWQVNFLDFN
jgi:hypothetical protein